MPRASHRGQSVDHSPIRRLAPYSRLAERAGKEVFYLNIGQPDIPCAEHVLEPAGLFQKSFVPYGPAEGLLALREAFASYYASFSVALTVPDIFVTTGASEAIFYAISACCDPGDEIIVPEPFYANYLGMASMCNVQMKGITTSLSDNFTLPDNFAFKERITDRTRAILLCNPGNPTGQVYTQKQLEAIIQLAIAHDLFLIVDEVYKEFCFEGSFYSVLEHKDARDHIIVIDSVSKIFNLCGARVGFLVTRNEEIQETVLKFAQVRLCPPAAGQQLALRSFKNRTDYIPQLKKEYNERRQTLMTCLNNISNITYSHPLGAFYTMAQLPVDNTSHFCQWLLEDFTHNNKTLMLAPADGFYLNPSQGQQQVRIAYILDQERIKEAMDILERALAAYTG